MIGFRVILFASLVIGGSISALAQKVDLQQAIRLDTKFARAYAVRGIVGLKLNQEAAAPKDFDRAFQLDPALHAEFDPIINQLRTKPPN